MKLRPEIEEAVAILEAGPSAPGYLEAFGEVERYARGPLGTVISIVGVCAVMGSRFFDSESLRWTTVAVGLAMVIVGLFASPARRLARIRRALDGARDHVNRLNIEMRRAR